jgi:glucose/arabinose dehydrogenase
VPRFASSFSAPRRPVHRWVRCAVLLVSMALAVSLAGCASFPDVGPRNWHDKPNDSGPVAAPVVPEDPDDQSSNPQSPAQPDEPNKQPKPNGCDDPDPLVIATCLDPVSALAVLPNGEAALVAERATGRILQVQKGSASRLVATVPVDASGGGLIGLVLSPSYEDDQLLYAYIATPSDHRVVRVATDGSIVPILTAIPRTAGNDAGALSTGRDGALLVATGTDGTAAQPGSLAGKVLRIDTFGHPFKDNPDPHSPIYSSGLRSPGGLCVSMVTGLVWATDTLAQRDALYQVTPGQLGRPVWNWPDRPGVAGCATAKNYIAIAERDASSIFTLQTNTTMDSFTGIPVTSLAKTYGHLTAATLGPGNYIWLGTANKGTAGPVASSDDRVIRLPFITAGGGPGGPD